MTKRRARVLVVDDSAFARKVIREVLSADPELEVVGIAHDGLDALEKITELDPDVVTLDLLMPHLDGIGVLQALADRARPRCVVVSTSDHDSVLGVRALEAGAFDIVHKPTALATDRLYELSSDLLQKVKVAAAARGATARALPNQPIEPAAPSSVPPAEPTAMRLVALGASTGGPQALTKLLSSISRAFPVPIAVVLHMPVGYTKAYAQRLNEACSLDVFEASDGALIAPGQVAIARAGLHMRVEDAGTQVRVRLDAAPFNLLHCPSVDVLFSSAAAAFGPDIVAGVLTGMGEDGLRGARAIHAAGGMIIAESESSCVVYGMPRAVTEAGLCEESVPLSAFQGALWRALSTRR
jgi:two-component system chemotaxis response regulator CheB